MREIGYRGCLDVGYRHDARDGTYKINDVNPRVGAMFRCFVGGNGMDIVRAMYQDLTGDTVTPTSRVEGRVWCVENNDFYSFLHYRRRGQLSFKAWRDSVRGVAERSYLASDDIGPFVAAMIVDARSLAKRAFSKALRWILRRRPGSVSGYRNGASQGAR